MTRYKIVETDNFGGDYPNEKFVGNLPAGMSEEMAEHICKAINEVAQKQAGANHPRFWKVVPDNYQLQPGFEA